MTANVTKLEDNKVRIDVEVSAEAVRKGVEAKFRELRRDVRVPGFRPGKAPRRVIENRVGRDYLYMEALQESLPRWYSAAVVESNLRPIDRPEIHFDDPLDEKEGFRFSATVEVRPEASLGDYKGVEVPRQGVEVEEEAVEEALEGLRDQFATLAAVEDRPVREGDFVVLDYKGERMMGGALEGAEAEDLMLEVGGGELLPDFENNLVGMGADERKRFGVMFPADYHEESLSGASVLFNVHVKEIKERDLPPLDDELAKEASEFETIEELKGSVREQMGAESERRAAGEFRVRVLDTVVEGVEIEIPEVMVEDKGREMVESFERSILAQGIEPERYYELAGSSPEDVLERVRDDAADTVRKELVLEAVAAAEGLRADEETMMHEISHLAEDSERSPEEIAAMMRKNGTYQLLEEEITRSKALDFLVENAVPVPMPEEESEEEASALEVSEESADDVPGTEESGPGEARVEASIQVGEGPLETSEGRE